MNISAPGLRERKRAETRDRLETAAVELVLANGLEHATIDAICLAADVSSRTFFNYFDSKEDAILGLRDPDLTDEAIAEALETQIGSGPVESIMRLVFGALNPTANSSALFASRMKILKQHPAMLGRMADQMQRMTAQFVTAIRPILGEAPGFASDGQADADADVSIEIMLSLCSAAARAAMREWTASGNKTPLAAVEARAVALATNTVKRLA